MTTDRDGHRRHARPVGPVARLGRHTLLAVLSGGALLTGCGTSAPVTTSQPAEPAPGPTGEDVLVITAAEDACTVSVHDVTAGPTVFTVHNAGARPTRVSLRGPLAPAPSVLVTAAGTGTLSGDLPGGDYTVVCQADGGGPAHTAPLSADGESDPGPGDSPTGG